MRKVVAFLHVSLDGFVAGPHGELEWAIVDAEIEPYVDGLLSTVDTAIYGRVVYQMMERYWPTVPANPSSTQHDIDHAHWVENVSKIVFSRTLEKGKWNNTRLVKENGAEEISRLKSAAGGDMMIFGSPSIVHLLAQHGLIDEYQLCLNPILLGSGISLFEGNTERVPLQLTGSKTFHSGVVGLSYQTIKG